MSNFPHQKSTFGPLHFIYFIIYFNFSSNY